MPLAVSAQAQNIQHPEGLPFGHDHAADVQPSNASANMAARANHSHQHGHIIHPALVPSHMPVKSGQAEPTQQHVQAGMTPVITSGQAGSHSYGPQQAPETAQQLVPAQATASIWSRDQAAQPGSHLQTGIQFPGLNTKRASHLTQGSRLAKESYPSANTNTSQASSSSESDRQAGGSTVSAQPFVNSTLPSISIHVSASHAPVLLPPDSISLRSMRISSNDQALWQSPSYEAPSPVHQLTLSVPAPATSAGPSPLAQARDGLMHSSLPLAQGLVDTHASNSQDRTPSGFSSRRPAEGPRYNPFSLSSLNSPRYQEAFVHSPRHSEGFVHSPRHPEGCMQSPRSQEGPMPSPRYHEGNLNVQDSNLAVPSLVPGISAQDTLPAWHCSRDEQMACTSTLAAKQHFEQNWTKYHDLFPNSELATHTANLFSDLDALLLTAAELGSDLLRLRGPSESPLECVARLMQYRLGHCFQPATPRYAPAAPPQASPHSATEQADFHSDLSHDPSCQSF